MNFNVDMFPYTDGMAKQWLICFRIRIGGYDILPIFSSHVETCVLLIHQKSTEHFIVDYEPENGNYMEKLSSRATYTEIKQWIAANYNGMKVSSLYVAQIKQKHDIIECECYNKPKSDNAKVPKCPPEKEAAIEAALRHFKMI